MARFYVIYSYVFFEWRSIRSVEINEYDITMGNDVARDIHCDVTMSNDVAVYTYGITMHNDSAMNIFYHVSSPLYLIVFIMGSME